MEMARGRTASRGVSSQLSPPFKLAVMLCPSYNCIYSNLKQQEFALASRSSSPLQSNKLRVSLLVRSKEMTGNIFFFFFYKQNIVCHKGLEFCSNTDSFTNSVRLA